MSEENPALLTPGAAAQRLGVSGSALRRLATTYVEAYGELPAAAGGGRLWPVEAVDRLRDARALLASGRARSIRDALGAIEAGAQVSVSVQTPVGRDFQALEFIAQRLEGIDRLEREVASLRREVSELRALPESEPTNDLLDELIASGPMTLPQRLGKPKGFADGDTGRETIADESDRERTGRDGALVRFARRLERLIGRR
jgi:hypothetical protein